MFGPDEQHVDSDASIKTQPRSGILTPVSDDISSSREVVGGRKRKRDESTMDDLLKDRFVVKPYPSTSYVKPQSLQPLLLLPRSQLPLSSLDFISSTKPLSQSRLFEAHVKILELEERMGSQPMVLIARLDDGRKLYAVERESRGLYVLCQIGSWVSLHDLKAASVASKQEEDLSKDPESRKPFAQDGNLSLANTAESNKYSKKKRLAIEAIQSMVKRPSTGLMVESHILETPPEEVVANFTQDQLPANPNPIDDVPNQPTADEIYENVRNQYFEALYISKASLAYFAKGPLSRARAAFHLDYDSNLDLKDLIAFLESLVLSTTQLDKKYRDGIPACISSIDLHDNSADEVDKNSAKIKKRKASKKVKPGKSGLYPSEDNLVRRWWAGHDDNDIDSGAPGSSREEVMRNRISQLRIRETQLQMIVILEVLALQPLVTVTEDNGGLLPTALPSTGVVESKELFVKSKKPDSLSKLIDVHIDRLCIWQSVSFEFTKTSLGDSRTPTDPFSGPTSQAKHTDNILRDFCVEVIAPFFTPRLPDRCAIINKKLGGPVVVSPPKPKLSKLTSSPAISRPGAATKRPVPAKPRRSLKRVLTDDRERRSMSKGPNRAISLMRSATMPIMPGMKREGSEVPSLSSIPVAESQVLEANRGGVLNSKRFSRREVDLSSLAPEMNPKAKKQAAIDAELKEAISALKKPNRELAGKSLVDTAEKRSATASSIRKTRKPIRNPLFQSVQISATPKANRQKDMLAESQRPSLLSSSEHIAVVPTSSLPRVPQSVFQSSRTNNPLFSSVQATPTRKQVPSFSGRADSRRMDHDEFPPSSPLHVRRSSAQLFTTIPQSTNARSASLSSWGIQETPVKMKPVSSLEHSHPRSPDGNKENRDSGIEVSSESKEKISSIENTSKEDSIYKALGWDDGDDIDDLA